MMLFVMGSSCPYCSERLPKEVERQGLLHNPSATSRQALNRIACHTLRAKTQHEEPAFTSGARDRTIKRPRSVNIVKTIHLSLTQNAHSMSQPGSATLHVPSTLPLTLDHKHLLSLFPSSRNADAWKYHASNLLRILERFGNSACQPHTLIAAILLALAESCLTSTKSWSVLHNPYT